jgi:protein TonB
MRRFFPAALIAILFHFTIFALDPGWFINKEYKVKKPSITVSMSYRMKPKPPPPFKKTQPGEIKKKKVPDVVEKIKKIVPEKVIEKIREPVILEEIVEETVDSKEDIVVPEQFGFEDAEDYSISVEESDPIVITEAEPLYRTNPKPRYPKMAKKRGYEGIVILSVLVTREGTVGNLWLFESSGYNMLDNAAMKAVKEWTFEPGRRGNEPVEMWVEVPVRFELK